MNKQKLTVIILSILIFLGGIAFVYAEIDDSPGGQLIGLLVAALSTWRILKML